MRFATTGSAVLGLGLALLTSAPRGARAVPYSSVDPRDLGIEAITRSPEIAPFEERWYQHDGDLDSAGSFARPTNAWWTNFVLGRGPTEMEDGNGFQIPFVMWPAQRGMSAAIPFVLAQANQIENGFDSNINFVTLGAADVAVGHRVINHDALSVTLEWDAKAGKGSANARMPIVRGSPYLTMEYRDATPVFDTPQMVDPQHGVWVDGEEVKCPGSFEGSRFDVVLVQSDETWTIWSSHRLAVACQSEGPLLRAKHKMTGVVRAAVTNNCTYGRSAFHCEKKPPADPAPARFEKVLDDTHGTYPVGAKVSLTRAGNDSVVRIEWETRSMPYPEHEDIYGKPPPGRAPIAMVAMEHHRKLGLCDRWGSTLHHTDVIHRNLNGNLSLVLGDEWLLPYALLPVSWHSVHGFASTYVSRLRQAVLEEAEWDVPLNYRIGAGDPYNAGKMMSRIGQLALIAEELGEKAVAAELGKKLAAHVEMWASGQGKNRFVYDASWGGYISCGCLYDDCVPAGCNPNVLPADQCHCEPSQAYCKNTGPPEDCPTFKDPGMDFGNAYYNDHHFHWGYHMHAAAVAAHLDPAWGAKHKETLKLYARDIANPSRGDPFFPVWRHKDWYTGWSWASGIALGGGKPYRNGRNQESTSESIMAYYSLQLLGDALNDTTMRDWGRATLAAEVLAAQTYWQIGPDSEVYPEIIKKKTLMGILWQNLAQYQTWFGSAPYMVHGIQMMPFMPPSEFYNQPKWTAESYKLGSRDCALSPQCTLDGWVSLFVMQLAVLDPSSAWKQALALPDHVFSGEIPAGNGNSRAAVLAWIASRPQMHHNRTKPIEWPRHLECAASPYGLEEPSMPPFSPPPPTSPPPPPASPGSHKADKPPPSPPLAPPLPPIAPPPPPSAPLSPPPPPYPPWPPTIAPLQHYNLALLAQKFAASASGGAEQLPQAVGTKVVVVAAGLVGTVLGAALVAAGRYGPEALSRVRARRAAPAAQGEALLGAEHEHGPADM